MSYKYCNVNIYIPPLHAKNFNYMNSVIVAYCQLLSSIDLRIQPEYCFAFEPRNVLYFLILNVTPM